jgi:general secretion pathway protein M
MNAWWQGRSPREQWTLGGAAVLTLAVVLWLGLIEPLTLAARRAEARLAAARELDAWMVRVADEAERRRASGQPVGELATVATLSGLVSASTAEAGFGQTLKRVVPEEGGAVRLWFEGVPFDELLAWLVRMHEFHGVRVAALQVTREARLEGVVRANLTLVPPGAQGDLAALPGANRPGG